MMRPLTYLSLAASARVCAAVGPTVDLTYAVYTGAEQNGITSWLGMRYAAPPTGAHRFAEPQDPKFEDVPQQATRHGATCIATNDGPKAPGRSEDCLFLDVYAPSDAGPGAKLPVFVFLSGGGFNQLANANMNGTGLMRAAGNSFIFIVPNYRVGPYGFLATGGVGAPPANNGLRDQRKALEWVRRHVDKFGGDPGHVVLGGASAGAASVALQLTAYGGSVDEFQGHPQLFHGVAAESISFATVLTKQESEYQFDAFAKAAGCSNDTNSSSARNVTDAVACLRNKTSAELQVVDRNVPYPGAAGPPIYMWNPALDGDLVRQLPYKSFREGDFVKVPIIAGDDTNGGTDFALRTAASLEESNAFLTNQFPYLTTDQVDMLNQLYPNANTSCPAQGCYWRQSSTVYGELRYRCPSMYVVDALARYGVRDTYEYWWDVKDPTDEADGFGVKHVVEFGAIFGPTVVDGAPESYFPGKKNAAAVTAVQAYWAAFIRQLNPNGQRAPGAADWTTWNPVDRNWMHFGTGGTTAMETIDEGLRERCDYIFSIGEDIRQ